MSFSFIEHNHASLVEEHSSNQENKIFAGPGFSEIQHPHDAMFCAFLLEAVSLPIMGCADLWRVLSDTPHLLYVVFFSHT